MMGSSDRRVLVCLGAAMLGLLGDAAAVKAEVRSEPYVWKSVVIEGGGYVTGVVAHPREKGLTYLRTDIGGAYRRDSESEKWVPLTDWVGSENANLLGCESVAVDPSDANRVYLALGTYVASWSSNGAIARSADRGKSFQLTKMPLQMGGNNDGRAVGERLAVDPHDGRILFFGSRTAGLWRSEDRGATWGKVAGFPGVAEKAAPFGISFVVFDPASGAENSATRVMYAGVCSLESNLFRSEDGGKDWEAVPKAPGGFMPIHAAIAGDGMMYIPYGKEPGPNLMSGGGLWRLNTRTGEWKSIAPVMPEGKDMFGYAGISVSARDPKIVMATTFCRWGQGDSIFRSADGGETWKELRVRDPQPEKTVFDAGTAPYAAGITPHWMSVVAMDPFDDNHATFVTGFGLWRTHEAGNVGVGKSVRWVFDNRGLEEIADMELKSPPVGAHLVSAMGDIDGFRHDDLDRSPARGRHTPSIGTTPGLDFAGQAPAIFVRCGSDQQGYLSTDGAATWTEFSGKPEGNGKPGRIALSADGKAIAWTVGGGHGWYSHDMGATWKACEGLPSGTVVVSDRVEPGRFYAMENGGKLYRSDDGAASFHAVREKLSNGRLFASPAGSGDVWLAGKEKGLWHSTDGGGNFAVVEGLKVCLAVGFGKAAAGQGYPAIYAAGTIGSTTGVFRSDDEAMSWVRINDDAHQYGWIGQAVTGDPRIYGRVYLGTNGRGILYADRVEPGKQ